MVLLLMGKCWRGDMIDRHCPTLQCRGRTRYYEHQYLVVRMDLKIVSLNIMHTLQDRISAVTKLSWIRIQIYCSFRLLFIVMLDCWRNWDLTFVAYLFIWSSRSFQEACGSGFLLKRGGKNAALWLYYFALHCVFVSPVDVDNVGAVSQVPIFWSPVWRKRLRFMPIQPVCRRSRRFRWIFVWSGSEFWSLFK